MGSRPRPRPASAWRSSAPARRRSSSCRGSSRRSAAARLPAHAAVDHAALRPPDVAPRAPALPPRCRRCSASCARGVYWSRELMVRRLRQAAATWCARPSASRRLHLRRQVRDPQLRRKLEPDFRLGCKRVLLSNEWYPALRKPNVELVTDAITRDRRPPDRARRRQLARGRHDHPRHRLSCHRPADGAGSIRGRDGRTLAEAVGRRARRPTSARRCRASPTSSRSSGRTPGSGHNSMVFMIESQLDLRHGRDPPDGRARASRRVEVRPEAVEAFNDELQAMMPGTVWAIGLRELVPRRARAQHDAVAGLHVPLPPAHAALRRGRLRAARRGAASRRRSRR